ncbi:ABC transporter ATP-binding protein [Arenivirga flava]|uniref:ABC transporter ATP-binding protein n=1 Tax=Arenivirga flava TaxID=1930060 RepID=A0AA37XCK8_9MICO|nr:ABC transporter ATP-binding protein [Arenivirga flava]GMA26757.1 ABC transporter ATP-binding protein [Arenivirga flava]GMA29871.1 ABC transporter ATP-binding protein [Arenivirga flava]GMA30000.1 ABC transporter ATP-binding protein [Arenivirga flava]
MARRGSPIEVRNLTKQYGSARAVDDLSFTVEPGRVTGFLGPNGAGKTTTLRSLLGLIRPTSGSATIGGKRYAELDSPLTTVGAALEANSFHPSRSGRGHLAIQAKAAGVPAARVDEVLLRVGLAEAGSRKVGGYSLGMRQRLGLAGALLGDPSVLVLDEPINGLDPEGIRWMRSFLKVLAEEGRTVLISSHLLSEVQQTVDELVIIAKGRLAYQGDLAGLAGETTVTVDAPRRAELQAALAPHAAVQPLPNGLVVTGLDAEQVGAHAFAAGIPLSALSTTASGLEDVFLNLVTGEHTTTAMEGAGR